MKKKIIWAFLLLGFLNAYSQNKLNYGLILGADRFIGLNEKTNENFNFRSTTPRKVGFFIEKPKTNRLAYTASFTANRYYEGFSDKIVGFGFDDYPSFIYESGPLKYYDISIGLKYKLINNFFLNSAVFVSYHNNTHGIQTVKVNSVEGLFSESRTVAREDINGGINFGLSYELNPKNSLVIEPFSNVVITGANREKYIHTNYYYNTKTEHKYGRIYFSFGAKFKLNRNK